MTSKLATLKDVKEYFGFTSASAFSKEWKALSEKDQEDLKRGIGNGTLDY